MLMLLLALALAPASAMAQRSLHDSIDALFAPYAKRDTPGCAIAIDRHGKRDYERGYASANLEASSPVTQAPAFIRRR